MKRQGFGKPELAKAHCFNGIYYYGWLFWFKN
jgi:hypothetical protein